MRARRRQYKKLRKKVQVLEELKLARGREHKNSQSKYVLETILYSHPCFKHRVWGEKTLNLLLLLQKMMTRSHHFSNN